MIQRELFGDFNLGIWPKPQLKNLNAQVSLPTNTNFACCKAQFRLHWFCFWSKNCVNCLAMKSFINVLMPKSGFFCVLKGTSVGG